MGTPVPPIVARLRITAALEMTTLEELSLLTMAEFAAKYDARPHLTRALIRVGVRFNDIPTGYLGLHVAHLNIDAQLFQLLVRQRVHYIWELHPDPAIVLAGSFDPDDLAVITAALDRFNSEWPPF